MKYRDLSGTPKEVIERLLKQIHESKSIFDREHLIYISKDLEELIRITKKELEEKQNNLNLYQDFQSFIHTLITNFGEFSLKF